MTREQAITRLRELERPLRDLGVGSAALFGSVARGDGSDVSDIDIAVTPRENATVGPLKLLSLYGLLGDAFGHDQKIDVIILPTRNPALAAAVEREGVIAFP